MTLMDQHVIRRFSVKAGFLTLLALMQARSFGFMRALILFFSSPV